MLKVSLSVFIVICFSITALHASELFSKEEFPKTDFSKHIVPLEELYTGGPPRDGIKSIDEPAFISVKEAGGIYDDREPVVAVRIEDKAKAYPISILLYHEIINDELNGKAIFITHCPLCNTAVVFSRNVQGKILDFGTTGRVRDSNLVMYDRQTESWWQQFTGNAIIGEYAGTVLQAVNSQMVSFKQYSENFPDGLVLSQDTGYRRYYGKTPYPGYDNLGGIPFLYKRELDFRLPPLERVLAIANDSSSVIYPFSYLNKHPLINSMFGDLSILIISQASMVSTMDKTIIKDSSEMLAAAAFERKIDGRVLEFEFKNNYITDMQTQSEWNMFGEATSGFYKGKKLAQVDKNVHFAFAWLAFFPNTKIVRQ